MANSAEDLAEMMEQLSRTPGWQWMVGEFYDTETIITEFLNLDPNNIASVAEMQGRIRERRRLFGVPAEHPLPPTRRRR